MESSVPIWQHHKDILTQAGLDFDDIEKTRKHIHQNAECGFKEFKTRKTILGYFTDVDKDNNIREYATTGFTIDIKGTAPPTDDGECNVIALRADMDALPIKEETGVDYASVTEYSHMCGHDGHVAILIATGVFLKNHRDKIPSNKTIRLLFQPAEELVGGAETMVKEGCLEGVDEIYGYHNSPLGQEGTISIMPGPMMAGNEKVYIDIEGVGGHGSEPANATDPITAACHLHSAFHTIKSRNTFNTDVVVFTICELNSGTTFNVIPRTAKMSGTIRYYDEKVKDLCVKRIEELTKEICEGFNCTPKIFIGDSCPAVVNYEKQTEIVMEIAKEELGEDAINTTKGIPKLGSEDFSCFLQKVPGCFILLNNVKPGETPITMHSSKVDYNDNITGTGVYLYVRILEQRLGISLLGSLDSES
ncbi:unnamed protein product [Moneuplotes crassus]|uniref:Peptidase M20 dimerisation domain-containing protein n=1 Tax=Euplotes crassus TaxID=5936 RepID=A0AAD1UKN7_EUPCR|nr:unnamed protein product [Moneuplotes crassus]